MLPMKRSRLLAGAGLVSVSNNRACARLGSVLLRSGTPKPEGNVSASTLPIVTEQASTTGAERNNIIKKHTPHLLQGKPQVFARTLTAVTYQELLDSGAPLPEVLA